uniref:Uncharacterized protein n=1 Tax=Lepeophtheirus salmonis TaxID=72036 RepID=A0A0K2TBY5_LEPSM
MTHKTIYNVKKMPDHKDAKERNTIFREKPIINVDAFKDAPDLVLGRLQPHNIHVHRRFKRQPVILGPGKTSTTATLSCSKMALTLTLQKYSALLS